MCGTLVWNVRAIRDRYQNFIEFDYEEGSPGWRRGPVCCGVTAFDLEPAPGDPGPMRILAWTTTPWTLPSNSALAIGENLDYVKVKTFNPYTFEPVTVILAKARMAAYLNPKAAELKIEDIKTGTGATAKAGKKLTVRAHKFSTSAAEKIAAAGGVAEVIAG